MVTFVKGDTKAQECILQWPVRLRMGAEVSVVPPLTGAKISGQPSLEASVTEAAWFWSRRDPVEPALEVRALLKEESQGVTRGAA